MKKIIWCVLPDHRGKRWILVDCVSCIAEGFGRDPEIRIDVITEDSDTEMI